MQSPAVSLQPPSTFSEYLRSLGPGIVAMLTWLGAGDVVTAGVSGGNYGYALMWVLALAVLMRCVFVMLIAKYQLCNPRGESVVEGLIRLHPAYAPFLAIAAVILGHVYGSYMVVGCGETWVKLTGAAATWQWSILWSLLALGLVFRHVYRNVELVFKLMLGVLSVSLLGTAIWAGPNAMGIARGLFAFELPATVGPFDSVLVAIGMVGAVGGSMMNLAYPYFMEQKGWRGPAYRRVQFYDLLLAVVVMIMLVGKPVYGGDVLDCRVGYHRHFPVARGATVDNLGRHGVLVLPPRNETMLVLRAAVTSASSMKTSLEQRLTLQVRVISCAGSLSLLKCFVKMRAFGNRRGTQPNAARLLPIGDEQRESNCRNRITGWGQCVDRHGRNLVQHQPGRA